MIQGFPWCSWWVGLESALQLMRALLWLSLTLEMCTAGAKVTKVDLVIRQQRMSVHQKWLMLWEEKTSKWYLLHALCIIVSTIEKGSILKIDTYSSVVLITWCGQLKFCHVS